MFFLNVTVNQNDFMISKSSLKFFKTCPFLEDSLSVVLNKKKIKKMRLLIYKKCIKVFFMKSIKQFPNFIVGPYRNYDVTSENCSKLRTLF